MRRHELVLFKFSDHCCTTEQLYLYHKNGVLYYYNSTDINRGPTNNNTAGINKDVLYSNNNNGINQGMLYSNNNDKMSICRGVP